MPSYWGGKWKSSKAMSKTIAEYAPDREMQYLEPFCGGCAVANRMFELGYKKIALGDIHPDLIILLEAIKAKKTLPFSNENQFLSKEEFKYWKSQETPSLERAVVGFCHTWMCAWFSSHHSRPRQHCDMPWYRAKGWCTLQNMLQISEIRNCTYEEWNPKNCIIYCDPPYKNTLCKYLGKFDHEKFWKVMDEWAKFNIVFVSEFIGPNDCKNWKIVWKTIRTVNNTLGSIKHTEFLWMHL